MAKIATYTLSDEKLTWAYWLDVFQPCQFYQRYVQKVYRLCLSIIKDQTCAQNFIHDIFLKLVDKLRSFQEKPRVSRRPHAIVSNDYIGQLRLAKRFSKVSFSTELGSNTQLMRTRWQLQQH